MLKKIPTKYLFLLLIIASIYSNFKYLSGKVPFFTKKEFQLKLPNLDYKENARYLYKGKVKSVISLTKYSDTEYSKHEDQYDINGNIITSNITTDNWFRNGFSNTNYRCRYNKENLLEYSEKARTDYGYSEKEVKHCKYNKVGNMAELEIESYVTKFEYEDYPNEHLVKVIQRNIEGEVQEIDYYKYDDNNHFIEAYITDSEDDSYFYSFDKSGKYFRKESENRILTENEGNIVSDISFYSNTEKDCGYRFLSETRRQFAPNRFMVSYYYYRDDNSGSEYNYLLSTQLFYKYQHLSEKIIAVEEFNSLTKRRVFLGAYKCDFHDNIIYNPTDKYTNKTFTYYE